MAPTPPEEDRLTEGEQPHAAADRAGRRPRRAAGGRDMAEPVASEEERDFYQPPDLDDDERFALFEADQLNSVLPDLPITPGYHVFWATTNNARDSVERRLRLGYAFIRPGEIPGWEGMPRTLGRYGDVIQVEEMVAMKLPLPLYNRYMRHIHHALPLSEEEKIRARLEKLKDEAVQFGSRIIEGDGTAQVVQRAKAPRDLSY